jgi:peroxiredoxin
MLRQLAALGDGVDTGPRPLVITTGDPEQNRRLITDHKVECLVLLQQGNEVASQYNLHGTPMGYLIDEAGRIASDVAIGADALLALAEGRDSHASGNGAASDAHKTYQGNRTLVESHIKRDGLAAGTPAPDFTLPRIEGGELSLSDFRGKPLLIVFSDPNCGPCSVLAPQLEAFHRRTPQLSVLMLSRGTVEDNQRKAADFGFSFPVVLQKQWEISRLYAMFATPIGYLIDENGIIASDVAVGVEPILALSTRAAMSSPQLQTNGLSS